MTSRISNDFFLKDVLEVAPQLLGKNLCVSKNTGIIKKYTITEVEAYRGEEDLACHASKGRTNRNSIMYAEGGFVYVYLIYGMYWMLNFVTGKADNPQAVLIRSLKGFNGPGILTRELGIDKTFYGENLFTSRRIWIENNSMEGVIITGKRIGVDYSGDFWKNMPWRYTLNVD